MISWVNERRVIFVDRFVPVGCMYRMKDGNTLQGLENVKKWLLLEMAEKGPAEGCGERWVSEG